MSTGLDTFDKTVQESNLWLKDVMERLNTNDRHHAFRPCGRCPADRASGRCRPSRRELLMLLRGLFSKAGILPRWQKGHETAFAHISMSCRVPRRREQGACRVDVSQAYRRGRR
jgi:hypothetical protein